MAAIAAAAVTASAIGAATAASADVAVSSAAVAVDVATKGDLPGFKESDLPAYFAAEMNSVGLSAWRFAPASPGATPSPNRIELSFKANPYAAGSVRTYGFSRATMERLLNTHHSVTIEAQLYLNGEYQTLAFDQVTVTGGPQDQDLDAAVARLTRDLMAYPLLDTTPRGQRRDPDLPASS